MEALIILAALAVGAYHLYRAGKKLGSQKGFGAALRRRSVRRWRR